MNTEISQDIFDYQTHNGVYRHFLNADSLAPECYTSKAFFDREVDGIFLKSWLFVGRDEQIAKVGDFFVVDLLGESVLVTRTAEGNARAFHNFCRHRGMRLADNSGNKRLFVCPYHSWCYDPGGQLVRAPDMEKSENWDAEMNGLLPVRLEAWEGFLFINFSNDEPCLADALGDLPQKFDSYNLSDMTCVKSDEYAVGCNWKLYTEVDMEDYHAPSVHPKSIGLQVFPRQPSDGDYETTYFENDRTISVPPSDTGPVFPRIETITGMAAKGSFFTMIYPSFFLVTTVDSMWWINKIPVSPSQTRVQVGFNFPRSTLKHPEFDEIVKRYFARWDLVLKEDNDITERHQSGISSRFCLPGRLSHHEEVVNVMNRWVLEKVLGPNPAQSEV
jgi:choline monooxygenase